MPGHILYLGKYPRHLHAFLKYLPSPFYQNSTEKKKMYQVPSLEIGWLGRGVDHPNPPHTEVMNELVLLLGQDCSVGTVTCYGLDGPWIESPWRRDFPQLSRPVLKPTQPPLWVSFPRVERPGRGVHRLPPSSAEVRERVQA